MPAVTSAVANGTNEPRPSNLQCRMICIVFVRVSQTFFHKRDLQNSGRSCCVQTHSAKLLQDMCKHLLQQPACDRATCKRLIRAMYLSTVGSMVG